LDSECTRPSNGRNRHSSAGARRYEGLTYLQAIGSQQLSTASSTNYTSQREEKWEKSGEYLNNISPSPGTNLFHLQRARDYVLS